MSERCLQGVWKVPGSFLKGVWIVSERCLEGDWKVSGRCQEGPGEYEESQLKARLSQDRLSQGRSTQD